MPSSDSISVFVRVRPLAEADGTEVLKGLTTKTEISSSDDSNGAPSAIAIEANDTTTAVGGFTGVMGNEASNRDVFEAAFSSRIPTVMKGGTASVFSYGYSGAGKTHTMLGQGEDQGIYQLATERVLGELAQASSEDGPLFLQASACEVVGDNVLDLLGPEKVECTLGKDIKGVWQVCGQAERLSDLDPTETGIPTADSVPEQLRDLIVEPKNTMTLRGTFITRSQNLRTMDIKTSADLAEISKTCVQQCISGDDAQKEQSSRSHAIVKMEVVNQAVLDARSKVEDTRAKIPARKNALDNHATYTWNQFYDGTEICLRERSSQEKMHEQGDFTSTVGTWKIVSDEKPEVVDACALEGKCDGASKTIEEWEKELAAEYKKDTGAAADAPFKLFKSYRQKHREFAGAPAEKVKELETLMESKKKVLEGALAAAEAEHKTAVEELEAVVKKGRADGTSPLGGTLVFVDLAAAESNKAGGVKKTPQQRREGMVVNKSLLALKECFSSLAIPADSSGQKKSRIRDSKITRVLEDSLAPTDGSSRSNKDSVSVMIVNVAPTAALERSTLNTLRYGQMYAYAATNKGRPMTSRRASKLRDQVAAAGVDTEREEQENRPTSRPMTSRRMKGKASAMDPAVAKQQLMAIYKQHCPEKTEADVDMLLSKCVGRERILLKKVRVKYLSQGQEIAPLSEVMPAPAIPGPVGTAAIEVGGNQEAS
jgi:hypothetical protein